MCDMAAAKRQRLTGEGAASPVSLEMLEEWEAYQKACKMAVFNCTEDGEMDLGEQYLHELSVACTCPQAWRRFVVQNGTLHVDACRRLLALMIHVASELGNMQ